MSWLALGYFWEETLEIDIISLKLLYLYWMTAYSYVLQFFKNKLSIENVTEGI